MCPPHLSPMQKHLVATAGEFVGTFLFLYLSYAGNLMAASRASSVAPTAAGGGMSSQTVIFISLAYSFSLLVNVWAFYRISGGLFNPAVSLSGLLRVPDMKVENSRVLVRRLPWRYVCRTNFLGREEYSSSPLNLLHRSVPVVLYRPCSRFPSRKQTRFSAAVPPSPRGCSWRCSSRRFSHLWC